MRSCEDLFGIFSLIFFPADTKSYDALLDTLVSLCSPSEGRPRGAVFHMSWQRRLKESDVFFQKAVRRGFVVTPHPQRMFELALAPLVLD